MKLRAAVFASGRGTNFQVLAEYGSTLWEVALLVTDREEATVLDRAAAVGIERVVIPITVGAAEVSDRMLSTLEIAEIDIVLLAGYLRLIPREVVQRYHGRMLNIHPALLPSFGGKGMYGERVHEAVLKAGARLSGVTVHFVDEEYDKGRILAQWPVPVILGDTSDTLAARIHEVEHALYPAAVDHLAGAILDGSEPSPIPGSPACFDLARHLLGRTERPSNSQS